MKGIDPKELNTFGKFIFYMGWFNILNITFWVSILVVNAYYKEKEFWNPRSWRVVYLFGWITLITSITIAIVIVLGAILANKILQMGFF